MSILQSFMFLDLEANFNNYYYKIKWQIPHAIYKSPRTYHSDYVKLMWQCMFVLS